VIPVRSLPVRSALRLGLLATLVAVLGACAASAAASFDPLGPCSADGQRPGAYPDLEARIPDTFDGAAPTRLDSGRNCTAANLGTLSGRGIDELRFAGGLWETGSRSGVTVAAFRAPGLTMGALAEFYETGARGARKTENVTTSDVRYGAVSGRRLDTLNDESFQTIVVLEGGEPDVVRAVLVASDVREIGTREAHDELVARACEAAVAP
jgi:hypothetical protein